MQIASLQKVKARISLLVSILVATQSVAAATSPFADSVVDFPPADNVSTDGKQGLNGWQYGYHNFTRNGGYSSNKFIPFPDNRGPNSSSADFWDGKQWDWPEGNPPWDFIGSTAIHSNGVNSVANPGAGVNVPEEHWVIRRYQIQDRDLRGSGNADLVWTLRKLNPIGSGQMGVSGLVFQNDLLVDQATIAYDDNIGVSRKVTLFGLQTGDFIDLVHSPVGFSNDRTDGHDGSEMTALLSNSKTNEKFTLLLADSVADFPATDSSSAEGKQGLNNWYYGYHNATLNGAYDANPRGTDDFIAFPDNKGPGTNPEDYWIADSWDWPNGNPPWTGIGIENAHPNGTNNGQEHWAIRRWVAEQQGDLLVEVFFTKTNLIGGDGISGSVFLNGKEVFNHWVVYNDNTGVRARVLVKGVQHGDYLDIVLKPNDHDGHDGSRFGAKVFGENVAQGSKGKKQKNAK